MIPGYHMLEGCCRLNNKRLKHSIYKAKAGSKIRRKILRGLKKKKADKDKDDENSQCDRIISYIRHL